MSGPAPDAKENRLAAEAAADVGVVARGGAVQITGQISARSLAFFFQAVAVRLVGLAPFGRYRLIAQILTIGSQLGLLGLNYASMRFITRARARGDHGAVRGAVRVGITGTIVGGLVIGAVLVFAPRTVALAFERADDPSFLRLLQIGAAYVPLYALLQTLRYCTQAYKTMVPSVLVGNIIQPMARFILGAALLVAGMHITGLVVSLVVSAGIAALAAAWFLRRMMTSAERASEPVYETKPMMRFAFPQAGASLLGVQSLGLGLLILGRYGDVETGLFAVALALQGPGGVFLGGIVNIWAPVVSDLYERGEIERLESMYRTITRWVATFSFPVFALLVLEADLFVRLFAGREGQGAEAVVVVLALGNFFYTGTGPTGYVLSMTGRPGLNLINSLFGVALYIGLGVLVVPQHGALGMAAVDAVVTALINTVRVIQAKVVVGIQPFGRSFLKPVVATAVGAAFLLAWRLVPGDGLGLELGGIAVAACIYLLVLRFLGLDPEERYVWDQIRSKIGKARGRRR